jgi:hypothetical protein
MSHFTQDQQKYETNAFDSLACLIKDCFYPKSWLNAVKTQKLPNWAVQFGKPEVPIFLARVSHTGLKKVYCVKQKANSNEGSNMDTQDEKLMFTNDKKQQKSVNGNLGARTRGA